MRKLDEYALIVVELITYTAAISSLLACIAFILYLAFKGVLNVLPI